MVAIHRDPAEASKRDYDNIIIGGGIYGAMLALESARRGLKPLLLERGDFGAATSFNSLRILHGGLRYLQNLDLRRFRESVRERRWFLKQFPELTQPLPCLMPLYGNGMYRPSVLYGALRLNDALSWWRNISIPHKQRLPRGRIVRPSETLRLAPAVRCAGLKGAAVWFDACMPDSQRVVMETLRWAIALGATVLNYTEAVGLVAHPGGVTGVTALERVGGGSYEYRAPVVVNATGPWSSQTAQSFGNDAPDLFRPSLAWNVLFRRPAISRFTLAVAPNRPDGQMYFLQPWKGKIFAGTGHSQWQKGPKEPAPTRQQITRFLTDINNAVPGLDLGEGDISRVFAGLLPAANSDGTLAVREKIVDHGEQGGPEGLFSISGVKFTTSRLVAEKTIQRIISRYGTRFSIARSHNEVRPESQRGWDIEAAELTQQKDVTWKRKLQRIVEEESVVHIDDLVFRRTTLWEHIDLLPNMPEQLVELFDWDDERREREVKRLRALLADKVFIPKPKIVVPPEITKRSATQWGADY